jgi:hypothetical protein
MTRWSSAETRRALYEQLAAPPGTVNVTRRTAHDGHEELVVMVAPGVRLPADRAPAEFQGYRVAYETRAPVKALA